MALAVKKVYSNSALRDLAQQFEILADPTRLIVLGLLAKNELNISAIAEATGMTHGAVSHHLLRFYLSKFVEKKRDGSFVIYSLTDLGRAFVTSAERLLK